MQMKAQKIILHFGKKFLNLNIVPSNVKIVYAQNCLNESRNCRRVTASVIQSIRKMHSNTIF